MNQLLTLDDLALLTETVELECKLAQGRDGKGELPKDFWPTYCAFANTHGGVVFLGIGEKNGQFSVAGLEDPEKIRRDLFSTLNDKGKVSLNLLTDADVQAITLEGKTVLQVCIPAATRKQKPVYLHGNPFNGNTYRRLNEGDMALRDNDDVRRMLAEQVEDERDARILPGFGLDDIDADSLRIYRQMLRDEKPGHPFLEQDDFEFLHSLRGWRRDRQSGESGLTLAGLLMFGKWAAIQEGVPLYFLDYQERPEAKAELRWVDRLVPDGTWSGNLFEFYRRVYRKLTIDLKVPFSLKGGQRQDDTPVHEALREALVNTLVHADYSGRLSILVVKRPDMFGFRNPGGLRLPLEQVIRGGESDCRNRILHQMFLLIGLGERGGSGIPKIYSGWTSRHWRQPRLHEKDEPEQTLLELHMVDLLPGAVMDELRERYGERFDGLSHAERLILATAAIESSVNHARLSEICNLHSHDLSLCLARLERDGWLESEGQRRGKRYHLVGAVMVSPDQVFPQAMLSSVPNDPSSGHNDASSGHSAPSSGRNDASSGHSVPSSAPSAQGVDRDRSGCLISPLLDAPIVDDLESISPELRLQLEALAEVPREKARLKPEAMASVVLALCQDRYLTLSVLAQLVNRNPDALRKNCLDGLVKSRRIRRAFEGTPTHEKQSYRSVEEGASGSAGQQDATN